MRRILVTGANGFAGPYVAEVLSRRGCSVIGMSRIPYAGDLNAFSDWCTADLADLNSVKDIIRTTKPDDVIHLAAISFVAHSDVSDLYRSNVIGTRNLFEALDQDAAFSGKLLLASSANIYGNQKSGPLHEDLCPNPQSDYALSKVVCELLARMYADKVYSLVMRPFNYIGRGQAPEFLVPKIVNHVRSGDYEIELGNLDVARDFSDVRFVAEVIARLLDVDFLSGECVNICSGKAYSLGEVIENIEAISGSRLKISTNAEFVRSNEVKCLWGDATKLHRLIGNLDCPPITETLRWMLEK